MGEVYRARDTKLNRDVALKLLPEAFARDPEPMARFEREAKVLASLNHPNIAGIYGLQESASTRALVMELVEGPTLADRIRQGPIAINDALPIARQICEALEYAHEHGIVHRDLKPANIKVTADDAVKVLDFGLAKALGGDPTSIDISSSPTLSQMATQSGVILGTAAYLSPEQAKGKPVDRRADIWAFGCVLYEMLTGKRCFDCETLSDSLAAILKTDPEWDKLPASTPPTIRRLLRRCLERDPKRRLQAIGEARIALEDALSGTGVEAGLAPPPFAHQAEELQAARLRHALPWAVASVMTAGLLIALYVAWRATHSAPPPTMELSLAIAPAQQLFTADGPAVVISPDGTRVAYVAETSPGKDQIYVRELDEPDAKPLEGAEGTAPFFSPDGRWIGFFGTDGKLDRISVFGGAPVALCNADIARGASWGKDGNIIFTPAPTRALYRVSAADGASSAVTHLDASKGEVTHRWPQILPGGRAVLFTASTDTYNFEHANIEVASLATGQAKVLVEHAFFGRFIEPGYLTYQSGGSLFAVPFDVKELKLTGPPMPVLNDLEDDPTNGSAQISFSETGAAVYMAREALSSQVTVALVDRKGVATQLVQQAGEYYAPRYSPDGKRLALQASDNVWIYDVARATLTPLTFSNPGCVNPVWTPDGKRITCFRIDIGGVGSGMGWLQADGTGNMEPLTQGVRERQSPFSWSPDGRTLAFQQYSPATGACCEVWTLSLNSNGQPGESKPIATLGASGGGGWSPAFSPDGRWLAYQSQLFGTAVPQIFVVPYPGPGGKWQISVSGGLLPVWSRTGHELFFIQPSRPAVLAVVPYSVQGNSFQPGKPTILFQGGFEPRVDYSFYDIAPDGRHFAMFEPVVGKQAAAAPPTVVVNWSARIQRMITAGRK
jgi:Tol biopolymer transport system component